MTTAPAVVDASVALKWVLDDETAVEQATALRDDGIDGHLQLVAPSLWLYELANGLVSAVRRRRLTRAEGARSLAGMRALGVELADPEPDLTYGEAMRYGLSAYDAAYVALARALEAPLWTGDRALHAAVAPARAVNVLWIGDYAA